MNKAKEWDRLLEEGRALLAQQRAEEDARELEYQRAERELYNRAIAFLSDHFQVSQSLLRLRLEPDIRYFRERGDWPIVTLNSPSGSEFPMMVIGLPCPAEWLRYESEGALDKIGSLSMTHRDSHKSPTRQDFLLWLVDSEDSPSPTRHSGVQVWVCPMCGEEVGLANVGTPDSACSACVRDKLEVGKL